MPYKNKEDYKKNRKKWIKKRIVFLRRQLLAKHNNRCCQCGSTEKLEFNHIYEKGWVTRKLTPYRRILRYIKEDKKKLLNLLCERCNKRYIPPPF